MHVERVRPTVYRLTLHAYELSTLVAAARLVSHGEAGADLTTEARAELRQVLADYDRELARVNAEAV